jgi:hypothetical protein
VIATGRVLDVWHRPGNVHDSNGAEAFIEDCIREIRTILPQCTIEVRMDAAFFSDAIVSMLESERVEFTISVPFERFVALKAVVEGRKRWRHLNSQWSFFETQWKPKSWDRRHQRAGRLTTPQGKLTLTMSASAATKTELSHYLDRLKNVA